MINIILKDNEKLEINKNNKLIKQSRTMSNYFTDIENVNYIYLDNIKKKVLENIIKSIENEEYLRRLEKKELIEIINITDFLDMQELLDNSIRIYVENHIDEKQVNVLLQFYR